MNKPPWHRHTPPAQVVRTHKCLPTIRVLQQKAKTTLLRISTPGLLRFWVRLDSRLFPHSFCQSSVRLGMLDHCWATVPADRSTRLYEGYWLNFSNIYPWNFWHQSRHKFHHPQSAPCEARCFFPFQRFCLFVYKTILWPIPSGAYWAQSTISFISLSGGGGFSIHGRRNQLSRALSRLYKCLRLPHSPEVVLLGEWAVNWGPAGAGEPGHSTWPGLGAPRCPLALGTCPGDRTGAGWWAQSSQARPTLGGAQTADHGQTPAAGWETVLSPCVSMYKIKRLKHSS